MDQAWLRRAISRYTLATFSINRSMNAMIRGHLPEELTLDQYFTLNYVNKRGSCTSSELAEVFHVGKSTITAIITRLTDKGLISRVPHATDRRVIDLRVTEEGEKLTRVVDERIEAAVSDLLSRFAEPEAEAFLNTYERLAGVLSKTWLGGEGSK